MRALGIRGNWVTAIAIAVAVNLWAIPEGIHWERDSFGAVHGGSSTPWSIAIQPRKGQEQGQYNQYMITYAIPYILRYVIPYLEYSILHVRYLIPYAMHLILTFL